MPPQEEERAAAAPGSASGRSRSTGSDSSSQAGDAQSPLLQKKRRRVLVVGAGAAGCAAAWSLGRHPDAFEVHVWDKAERAGGVATSEQLADGTWFNDGVQGMSTSYHNTMLLHKEFGFEGHPVELRVSFGKNKTAWNNVAETELIEQHRAEIRAFGHLLERISRFEWFYALRPIRAVLRRNGFSNEFAAHMVYPLTALFFGTGNQTPHVSSAVIARVFLDPELRLFDYDPERLLSQTPAMLTFEPLRDIYAAAVRKTNATFHFQRALVQVERRRFFHRRSRWERDIRAQDDAGKWEYFDEIIYACDAETARRSLTAPRLWERWTLGRVKYFNDITVTHHDEEYMRRYYDMDDARSDQYFVRTDPSNPTLIEMGFNLSNYQRMLKERSGPDVYQTIFLNDETRNTWTMDNIAEDKVILRKWWRQFSHTWRHFAFVVPFVRFLQGRRSTWYCGSYTLFNTHEMAINSGLAVAHRLGAEYPFAHDRLAADQFKTLMSISHGRRARLASGK